MKKVLALIILLLYTNNNVFAQKVINLNDLGAKGDGKYDNYSAFLKAAQLLSSGKNITLIIPKGNYYVAQYHRNDNKIADIIIRNSSNIHINAEGAKVTLNGAFYRAADKVKGKYNYSTIGAIIPFYFINCTGITITGLEIHGGVNNMQRETGVSESGGHLMLFRDCKNVLLQNVSTHHAQSDGIYITGTTSAGFKFNNVTSANNGRQGMSIIQLFGGKFNNCKFINTGVTEGKYGSHAPRAGVDIEPKSGGGIWVKDIEFNNCIFQNNQGSQFVCSSVKNTSGVLLKKCSLIAATGKSDYQLILAATNIVLDGCYIDCGPGSIYPIANANPGSSVTIKNCTIKSAGPGIMSVSKLGKDQLVINNNTIEYTGKVPVKKYFLYIQTKGVTFTNNKILIPGQYQRKGGVTSLIQGGAISSGNIFNSGKGFAKPIVSYKGTKVVQDK